MSTQSDLAVSYDVSNDFFRLWLDRDMNYSCALFFDEGDSLERAQHNKLNWFYEKSVQTPQSRVIDVGCGWGGLLGFLSREKGVVDTSGLTLSRAQYDEVCARKLPGVSVHYTSYTDFTPPEKFDAAISIGMFEHLATPQQARAGAHIEIYRRYFRRLWQWTRPGARFGLQTVIGGRIPRERSAIRELGWATYTVFPGAISPRIEAVVASMSPCWEVLELHTRGKHYERTSGEWLKRLRANEAEIRKRWGDNLFVDYERYLQACVNSFASGYQSLAQFILRRLD